MNQLLAMGGYGVYVWTAYGITLAVLSINFIFTLKESKQIKKIIQDHYEQ